MRTLKKWQNVTDSSPPVNAEVLRKLPTSSIMLLLMGNK